MKKLYQLLLDRWNQKTDTVLVTIVEGNGSIPRTTGAYMAADQTGRIYGTIGGGNLEYQAVKKAITLAGRDAHFVEDFDLGTGENGGLGMICGGKVKVLFYSVKSKDTKIASFLKEALKMEEEKKKVLIVVDVQNDFVTGSLGTPEAQAIIPNVKEKFDEYKNNAKSTYGRVSDISSLESRAGSYYSNATFNN